MATTKNITISINNGIDYDTLYPTCNLANYTGSLPFTSVTGTVPLTQGGTGKTTAPLSLYALINGSTALTSTGLATGDYVGIGDVSAATGKKVTLTNLLTWLSSNMSSGGCYAETKSYTGTGDEIDLVFTNYSGKSIIYWEILASNTTGSNDLEKLYVPLAAMPSSTGTENWTQMWQAYVDTATTFSNKYYKVVGSDAGTLTNSYTITITSIHSQLNANYRVLAIIA